MEPVPFINPVRYPPLLLAIGYLVSIPFLTYAVTNSLYTSYKLLGPGSSTRSRTHQRRRFLPVFIGLAVTALSVALYHSVKSAILSYETWAYEHGLDLTQRLLGEDGNYITDGKNLTEEHIANWLSDTLVYKDVLEIVAEKTRRFWWGQQIDLGMMAFSLMLATEGRRRKIPLLTALLALAHLVNLSFAQNLFFLALLLTPSPVNPYPDSPDPLPDVRFFYGAITLSFGFTLILPYAAGTSDFTKVALLARASTFLPVFIPKIVPSRWGTVQRRPYGAYESLTGLFKFLSAASFALHAKTSIVALLSNTPNPYYHRHSALLPWDVEERSRWEHSTTALGKILGSTSDHPAVAAVGWDVFLSMLSLGLWAAVRAINARDMLSSSIPSYNPNLSAFKWTKGDLRDEILNVLEPNEADDSENDHDSDHHESGCDTDDESDQESENGMALRRWDKILRPRSASIANSKCSGSSTSSGSEVTRTPITDGIPLVPIQRQTAGASYEVMPPVADSALEGDERHPQTLDWESASLAWGLAAVGGLASACAGVFGGECVSG
ncbi:hypothetical protein F4803DRAFT_531829 [Xylaria telfairii]|nr:hypothetical protein F4803DRAFT_531829 [Xylaria telfairii]